MPYGMSPGRGHFIGDTEGQELFDLTNCATGKSINQKVGWNINDPRH